MPVNDSLVFQVDGIGHEVELDDSFAPETLRKVIECLPAVADIHCAKIAGSHIMWPVPFVAKLEKASDVLSMPPGAFFFWPERQYLEITYDELQAENAAICYLGKLKGDVDWLREYADKNRAFQGRQVFTAQVFIKGNRSKPNQAQTTDESSALGRLRAARCAAWRQQPGDVDNLLNRRGLNIPFGPLSMAEGEARKLHELLWRLWDDDQRFAPHEVVSTAAFVIEAAISRLGGFCHMTDVGERLSDGIIALRDPAVSPQEALEELILYIGRVAAWLDLHICWHPMNELTRNAIEGRPITSDVDKL